MKLSLSATIVLLAKIVSSETTTYNAEQLSSASSRALESGVTVIYNFILDFNQRYDEYIAYMGDHGMKLPTAIGNYFVGIQTIREESVLFEDIKTRPFPFDDFATMVTKFDWYESIWSEAGATTFHRPADFLTGETSANESVVSETSSSFSTSSSSSSEPVSSSATSESSSSVTSDSSSEVSTLSSSSTSLESSSYSLTLASVNGGGYEFVPLISVGLGLLALL